MAALSIGTLHHVDVLVLRVHVVEAVRAERLAAHRTAGEGRRRGKAKVGGRRVAVAMAHVVVALVLVLEVVHLAVVGRGVVVVRVLLVLIVPEVVRFVVRHVRERAV